MRELDTVAGSASFPGFFRPVAEGVVFPQGRGHRRGRVARIRLCFGELSLGVVGVSRVNDSADGVGDARAQGFPIPLTMLRCSSVSVSPDTAFVKVRTPSLAKSME